MPNYKLCYHWTPPPVVYTCDECADCYQISISGLSDAICDDCDNWHGTHILERIGDCNWEWVNSDLGKTICGYTAFSIEFYYDSALDAWRLIVHAQASCGCGGLGGVDVQYRISADAYDCAVAQYIPRYCLGGCCLGWPDNLYVVP